MQVIAIFQVNMKDAKTMLDNIFPASCLPTWNKPKASVDNKSWQTIKVVLLFIVVVTQAVIHLQFNIDWIKSFIILKEFEEASTKKKKKAQNMYRLENHLQRRPFNPAK